MCAHRISGRGAASPSLYDLVALGLSARHFVLFKSCLPIATCARLYGLDYSFLREHVQGFTADAALRAGWSRQMLEICNWDPIPIAGAEASDEDEEEYY